MLTSMTTSLPLKVSFSHMGLFAHVGERHLEG